MKAHLRFIFVLIFPFLLFSIACTKETKPKEEIMPPYTETGANTFACKVNGKVWIAKGDFMVSSMTAWYSSPQKALGLSGYRNSETISFHTIKNVTRVGEYLVGQETENIAYYEITSNRRYYKTIDGYSGKLIVKKLDTVNHICSGTFYFDAISVPYEQNDTTYKKGVVVHITEGQFDFKYQP